MAINPSTLKTGLPADFNQAREASKVRIDLKIKAAALSTARTLSAATVGLHQNFLNRSLDNIERLRTGALRSLGMFDESKLIRCFPITIHNDLRINDATAPNLFDNSEARELRREYREAYYKARAERTQAERTAEKLGPGRHVLSNGDVVVVSTDRMGRTTVHTTSKDGTVKTVSFDKNNPNAVEVKTTNPDGSSSTLSQNGTNVSTSRTDIFGNTVSNKFSLNANGDPVKETSGPRNDQYVKTTAHDDGSTDKRQLIYFDQNGQPVYEDTHQDPGWKIQIWPPLLPSPPIMPNPWWRLPRLDLEWDPKSIDGVVPFGKAS